MYTFLELEIIAISLLLTVELLLLPVLRQALVVPPLLAFTTLLGEPLVLLAELPNPLGHPGGKGPLTTGVVFPHGCPAEYLAIERLSDERVWMFPIRDALRLSKQAVPRLYWYVDPSTAPQGSLTEVDVDGFRLERMLEQLTNAAD